MERARRQETPHCASVSFERHAANAFQRYVAGAINFSIKRGGVLYGSVGEGGHVRVDAIYEPPQVPALVEPPVRGSSGVCHAHMRSIQTPGKPQVPTSPHPLVWGVWLRVRACCGRGVHAHACRTTHGV